MTHLVTLLLLAGLATTQSTNARVDRVLRDLAEGRQHLDGFKVETLCLEEGSFKRAAAYGTGVAIWNGERQGTLTREQVLALVKAFAREGFARMPASFGEEEGDGAPVGLATRAVVKMTCRVGFSAGDVAKDVIQLDKGEQSAGLKRLARAIFDSTRHATRSVATVDSLDDGMAAIAAGRLAVETLRITMRSGAGRGTREASGDGWVLRVDGRDLEIEPDAGPRVTRRLDEAEVRELARAFEANKLGTLPVNVHAPDYVDVTVAVLRHERNVQARRFSGSASQDAEVYERFKRSIAPLVALRGR